MENDYSDDPRLDYVARRTLAATRIMGFSAILILAVHMPAKLAGIY